ncbi:hypothetical protein JOB18_000034 [Solea senegalensis]|uniref:Uncharacterized protein n=1 Tax=Solea senegalensis TaxID=28829 RepID=A0AAV6Q8W8_SOLSE|nr:hypothetical protein JOB18_000034 [Solea senegalensis]
MSLTPTGCRLSIEGGQCPRLFVSTFESHGQMCVNKGVELVIEVTKFITNEHHRGRLTVTAPADLCIVTDITDINLHAKADKTSVSDEIIRFKIAQPDAEDLTS